VSQTYQIRDQHSILLRSAAPAVPASNIIDAEHIQGLVGAMCSQESKAKEATQQLKFEVANLQRLAAADVAGARSAADQAALDDLQAQKAAISADRDAKVRSAPISYSSPGLQGSSLLQALNYGHIGTSMSIRCQRRGWGQGRRGGLSQHFGIGSSTSHHTMLPFALHELICSTARGMRTYLRALLFQREATLRRTAG